MDSEATSSGATPQPSRKPVGCLPYVIGGASFIPLVGVFFGIVAIIWGAIHRVKSLVIVGIAGICFTIILYGSLFYFGFVHRGGVFDNMRAQMAVTMLNSTVKEIEYYKLQHGHYPTSLKEIVSTDNSMMPVAIDPTKIMGTETKDPYFYYELSGDGTHYFLRSVGPDGIPFTSDDILPSIPDAERKNIGLLLRKEEANPSPKPASVTPLAAPPPRQP
jgi:hypothetical protein